MARALADMKQEIMSKAEMGSDSQVGQGVDEQSAATAAATADLSRRLESFNSRLDKSQKQLALAKEKEAIQAKELKLAREELAKKSNMLGKLRDEKSQAIKQHPSPTHGLGGRISSGISAKEDSQLQRELQEMKSTVRSLEAKLKVANKAEKPLESDLRHDVGDKVGYSLFLL